MQKSLYKIPWALLVLVYLVHGIEGFIGVEDFYAIVSVLGFSASVTALLVFLVGPLDIMVAALLAFKQRLAPPLPWTYLFAWAGLWPWIPRMLEWYGGLEIAFVEASMISSMAIIAYLLQRRFHFK